MSKPSRISWPPLGVLSPRRRSGLIARDLQTTVVAEPSRFAFGFWPQRCPGDIHDSFIMHIFGSLANTDAQKSSSGP
ncbi:MAG: hypothetical protein AB8C13_07775 [Phycisphaerales bacterium]